MQPVLVTVTVDPSIPPAEIAQKVAEIFEREFAAQKAETPEEESTSTFTAPIIDAPAEAQVIAIISRLFADYYDLEQISAEAWDRVGIFTRNLTTENRCRRYMQVNTVK